MARQKRVAAIHDISCFGKCSLTVALPILSAAGIEACAIPTAVLSTHTGVPGYTYRDLTEDILPIISHWQALGLPFDAIYTGFLGSFQQLDLVSEVFRRLRSKDTMVLVDPVMGDNGALYRTFPKEFPAGMRRLCAQADVIVPNMTEASLLLEEPYQEGPYTPAYIKRLLRALSGLGPRKVVLTGVCFDQNQLGAATLDAGTQKVEYLFETRVEGYYHGTGDIFASVLAAALLKGCDLTEAASAAVEFTAESIARTKEAGTDVRFGVNFEAGLLKLSAQLEL
ncbi:MAG: pyridoxamine kinase [Oscillospiraceae bacterium]|nr:pyridoxamine kinase [Oscillospiraceae bacterium]